SLASEAGRGTARVRANPCTICRGTTPDIAPVPQIETTPRVSGRGTTKTAGVLLHDGVPLRVQPNTRVKARTQTAASTETLLFFIFFVVSEDRVTPFVSDDTGGP